MMKKLTMTIGLMVGLVAGAFAGTNSVFNAKEFGVSLGSGYVVNTADAFQDRYDANLTVGVSYFLTRHVGIAGNVPIYEKNGVSVHEGDLGLVFRLPVAFVAPYVGTSAVYDNTAESKWAYIGKAGVEVRVNRKVGVFGEWQYRNDDFDFSNGSHKVVAGVKLVF